MLIATQALREFRPLAECYEILSVLKTIDDIRRENLRALAREVGGPAALARQVGVNEAQLSQWLNGSPDSRTGKPRGMRSVSCRRIEEATGKPGGWLDVSHITSPGRGSSAFPRKEGTMAQVMSPPFQKVAPTMTWDQLMSVDILPPEFYLALRDDAMAPRAATGSKVKFTRGSDAGPGDGVLVRAPDGMHHFRELRQTPTGWQAFAYNPAFPSFDLDGEHEVVAIFSGIDVRWSQLMR